MKPTRGYSVIYETCDQFNMFRAPLWPSSGARDYTASYNTWRITPWLPMVGGQVQGRWLCIWNERCCSSQVSINHWVASCWFSSPRMTTMHEQTHVTDKHTSNFRLVNYILKWDQWSHQSEKQIIQTQYTIIHIKKEMRWLIHQRSIETCITN
jgi:hypothetical protein